MSSHRLLVLPLLLIAALASAQNVDRIMQEALSPSAPLRENLRVLTDEIGGRVPGSPQFDLAEKWAVERFRQAGADSVRTEDFSIPQGWAEGDTRLEVVSPVRFPLRAQSAAWTPAVAATTARVVDVGSGSSADFAKAGDIHNALVLVHSEVLKSWDDLFAEYLRAPDIIARAVQGRALAIAFTATRDHKILYRHVNTLSGKIDTIPQLIVAREDAERLGRIAAEGKEVRVSLSVPNQVSGPIATRNVVAEMRGTELPNEIVIVGAHLDSWELGTGALDNGCNSALVIDMLRAFKAAGFHPRRTIRFILFSGEEQGMFGSLAYVRAHRDELDRTVAELVLDAGSGAINGFSTGGRKDVGQALAPMLRPFDKWKAAAVTNDAFVGTDNFDFMLEGVPTIVPNQDAANYLENYHAFSDTFDKVDFDQLRKNEAIAAALLSRLADLPGRIGPRLTRAEIEATFRETHLDDQLKVFRMWDDWQNATRGRKP